MREPYDTQGFKFRLHNAKKQKTHTCIFTLNSPIEIKKYLRIEQFHCKRTSQNTMMKITNKESKAISMTEIECSTCETIKKSRIIK